MIAGFGDAIFALVFLFILFWAALFVWQVFRDDAKARKGSEQSGATSKLKISFAAAAMTTLVAGLFAGHNFLGLPTLGSQSDAETQRVSDESIAELVTGLGQKIKVEGGTPQQWVLYARSLMTIDRYDEAFQAYNKVLELTDNDPVIRAEFDQARVFAGQKGYQLSMVQSGPTREDIDAAAQMSSDDRSAMIQGMVDGLSAKLSNNPDDIAGWVKLLRARKVLGQTEMAQKEITQMKAHFAGKPEVIAQILSDAAWNE